MTDLTQLTIAEAGAIAERRQRSYSEAEARQYIGIASRRSAWRSLATAAKAIAGDPPEQWLTPFAGQFRSAIASAGEAADASDRSRQLAAIAVIAEAMAPYYSAEGDTAEARQVAALAWQVRASQRLGAATEPAKPRQRPEAT